MVEWDGTVPFIHLRHVYTINMKLYPDDCVQAKGTFEIQAARNRKKTMHSNPRMKIYLH